MKFRSYVTDPVLTRANFRCQYCGRDLLGTLDDFLTIVQDHLVPRSAGGPDANSNRVCSCAACDRVKGGRVFDSFDEARAFVQQYRANVTLWFQFVREQVEG